jgi:hypothetical protein
MQPQYTRADAPDTTIQPRSWTPEEDHLLRALYFSCTRKEIAALLRRTNTSIRQRCYVLKLNQKHPAVTDDERAIIRAWYTERDDCPTDEFGLDELAQQLGRTKQFVARVAGKMGLTKMGRHVSATRKKKMGVIVKQWQAEHGHPRGMLGRRHTDEFKRQASVRIRNRVFTPEQTQARIEKMMATKIAKYGSGNPHWAGRADNAYSRTRSGKRADLDNKFFRSSWEANYARYLNWLISVGEVTSWEFECRTFLFEGQTRGVISYTPDFRVVMPDGSVQWHEVKGWMDDKSKSRLKKMAKFYPDETVVLIDSKVYHGIAKSVSRMIPNWEDERSNPRVEVECRPVTERPLPDWAIGATR